MLSNPNIQVKLLATLYQTPLFPLHLLTPSSPMYPGPPSKNEGLKPKKRKTCSNFTGPKCHFIDCIVISLSSKFGAQDEKGRLEKMKSSSASPWSGHRRRNAQCRPLLLGHLSRGKRHVCSLASDPIPVPITCLVPFLVIKHAHITPWFSAPLRCSLSM